MVKHQAVRRLEEGDNPIKPSSGQSWDGQTTQWLASLAFSCPLPGRKRAAMGLLAYSGTRSSGIVLGAYTRLQKRRRIVKATKDTPTKTATGINVVPSFCIDDPLLLAVVLIVPPEEPFRADPCLGS